MSKWISTAFALKPILLKRLLMDTAISQTELAASLPGFSRETLAYVLNRAGYLPGVKWGKSDDYKANESQ